MFKNEVRYTPLTAEAVDGFFSNITGDNAVYNDNTLLATARALLYPRIGDNEIQIITRILPTDFKSLNFDRLKISLNGARFFEEIAIIGNNYGPSTDDVKKWFLEMFPEYHEIEKIRAYYSKSFECCCLVNKETRSSVVFVENLGIKELHFLQLSMLVMVPWYFNGEKLTPLELRLINSLNQPDSDVYLNCLKEYYKELNLKEYKTKTLLNGVESVIERNKIERITREIADINRRIDDMNLNFREILAVKREKDTMLLGLKAKINSEKESDSNLLTYFLCNKSIDLLDVNNSNVDFMVLSDIEYFDQEIARTYITNKQSVVYDYAKSRNGEEADLMEKLLTEIFLTDSPRLKIKVCAGFNLDLLGGITTLRGLEYDEYPDYTPNPHIYHFSCLGNNVEQINKFLQHNDYIGAIEQCIAATKNLNWTDGAVINRFMEEMWKVSNNRIRIELPDGMVVDQVEAIAWLEENEMED